MEQTIKEKNQKKIMPDVTPALFSLHTSYCALTDRTLPPSFRHLAAWEHWQSKGFSVHDMELVVRYLKSLIKLKRRRPESFRFHLFVEDTDRFAEDLSEARAWARTPKIATGKADVLRATGRNAEINERPARKAGDILAADAAFKEFQKMRDSL